MSHSISFLALLCVLVSLEFSSAAQAQQPTGSEIFRIELVTRLDATIEGGGFETTGPVDRRLVKDVRNCIDAVHKVAIGWAREERLVIAREDRREESLILHFERPQQRGIYEVTYRVSVSRGYATGGFKFYDQTGTPLSGPTVNYQEFSGQLRKAMLCR
jgi:hypothetical protein